MQESQSLEKHEILMTWEYYYEHLKKTHGSPSKDTLATVAARLTSIYYDNTGQKDKSHQRNHISKN